MAGEPTAVDVNETISSLYLDNVKYDIKDNVSPASKITDDNITNWNGKGTYSKPSGGIPKTDLSSAVQTSLDKADSALQSFTETDPTVPSHVKSITSANITSWNSKFSLPTGGTTGQVLTKTSTGTAWQDAAKGGSSLDVLLQTAYDNLSDAEKMDGTFRFIYIEQ